MDKQSIDTTKPINDVDTQGVGNIEAQEKNTIKFVKSSVERINLDGKLGILNAAKVSFKAWVDKVDEKGERLIKYLEEHNHFSPFAHPQICFKMRDEAFARNYDRPSYNLYALLGDLFLHSYFDEPTLGRRLYSGWEGRCYRISYYTFMKKLKEYYRYNADDIKKYTIEDIEEMIEDNKEHFAVKYDEDWLLKNANEEEVLYKASAMPYLSFRVKVPLFVYNQLAKHQVGLIINQVSARYVKLENAFFDLDKIRKQADKNKQCSVENEFIETPTVNFNGVEFSGEDVLNLCYKFYESGLQAGGCREQMRAYLPANIMTEFVWTGGLRDFARVCYHRMAENGVQFETKDVATQIYDLCKKEYPRTFDKIIKLVGNKI